MEDLVSGQSPSTVGLIEPIASPSPERLGGTPSASSATRGKRGTRGQARTYVPPIQFKFKTPHPLNTITISLQDSHQDSPASTGERNKPDPRSRSDTVTPKNNTRRNNKSGSDPMLFESAGVSLSLCGGHIYSPVPSLRTACRRPQRIRKHRAEHRQGRALCMFKGGAERVSRAAHKPHNRTRPRRMYCPLTPTGMRPLLTCAVYPQPQTCYNTRGHSSGDRVRWL